MPKQSSMLKIRGKMDGSSYYYAGQTGYLMRKINPNMSTRVKEDIQFAETRLFAREFGMCAKTAGCILQLVNARWRCFRQRYMNAKMTDAILIAMRQDDLSPLGQRIIQLAHMDEIQWAFNDLQKNKFPKFFQFMVDHYMYWDASVDNIVITDTMYSDPDWEQMLANFGATGLTTRMYALRILVPQYMSVVGQYTDPVGVVEQTPLLGVTFEFSNSGQHILWNAGTFNFEYAPQNSQSVMGGVLFVVEPHKTVNGKREVLQSLCTMYWKSPADLPE